MQSNSGKTSGNLTRFAIAALLVGSVSIAATAGPRDRGHAPARHGGGFVHAFERIDADGDGVVTRAEFDTFRIERLAGLDADGDGAVTFEEAKAFRQAQREQRARERYARLDTNGDGTVSTDEAASRHERLFGFLDRNDDGNVSRDELPRRRGGG